MHILSSKVCINHEAVASPVYCSLDCRDPRSTMNALYHAEAVQLMLDMALQHHIPLLFITNNVCNKLLRFEDAQEVGEVGSHDGWVTGWWVGSGAGGALAMCTAWHCRHGLLAGHHPAFTNICLNLLSTLSRHLACGACSGTCQTPGTGRT